ncbi:MAG: HAMP domain-containing histidine kinase [Myxococcales bacterium]|nr:HAMP domain-containing histidine kinase [Myxococcales bacterium]
MRLSQKLVLFVLAAAVIPLAVGGFWVLKQAEVELSARLEREQRALAAASAEAAGTQLSAALDGLAQAASLIDWKGASADEAAGGLRLLAGQSTLVVAVALVDPSRAQPVPLLTNLEGRPAVVQTLEQLSAPLPLATLAAYGEKGLVALGPMQDSSNGPWLPAAIQAGPKDPQTPMLTLALTLAPLDQWLVERTSPLTILEIVDSEGRVVASSAWHQKVKQLVPQRLEVLKAQAPLAVSGSEQVATAPVPGKLGLSAVVSVPLSEARAPVVALRRTVLGGLGIVAVLLVVVAMAFVRRLTRRLEAMAQVAQDFGKGDLSRRVQVGGSDELTELGETFNAMGAELETARARLMRWNDELKQKVEEALADLRAAQAQLLETQKLAAIGQLGAGVAHEINNPLVGILGNAQLLLMDHPEGDADFSLLKQIEDGARRCREITQNLLRFSQTKGEVTLAPLDLVPLVNAALDFEAPRHAEAGVTVVRQLSAEPMRVDGDAEQLKQVVSQLCDNARTAMASSPEKKLTVAVRAVEGGGVLEVTDTGKGIAPEHLARVFEPFFTTKDVWSNIGLGLSVVYRVVEEHQGKIDVASEPGKGARFSLTLRAAGTAKLREKSEPAWRSYGGVGQGVGG